MIPAGHGLLRVFFGSNSTAAVSLFRKLNHCCCPAAAVSVFQKASRSSGYLQVLSV